MTDSKLQWALSSGSGLIVGLIIAIIFLRWYYHRILVSEGAKKEPPLSVFTAIVVGLVAILSALYSASVAIDKARQDIRISNLSDNTHDLATCINNVLGDRQTVSDTPALIEEAQAQADWSRAVLALFSLPKHPTAAQQKAETKAIFDATSNYGRHLAHAAAVLNANAAYRAAHPLGKC